jgi:hypothetical protein
MRVLTSKVRADLRVTGLRWSFRVALFQTVHQAPCLIISWAGRSSNNCNSDHWPWPRAWQIPGSLLRTCCILSHSILTSTLWGSYCYLFPLWDDEAEAQRDEIIDKRSQAGGLPPASMPSSTTVIISTGKWDHHLPAVWGLQDRKDRQNYRAFILHSSGPPEDQKHKRSQGLTCPPLPAYTLELFTSGPQFLHLWKEESDIHLLWGSRAWMMFM